MKKTFEPRAFFDSLEANSVLLTPNQRLASSIAEQYNHYQTTLGNASWPGLKIFPINTWFYELWQMNTISALPLLNDWQQLQIWQTIIKSHHPNLLKIEATAKMAIEATRLMLLWQVPFQSSLFSLQPDSDAYLTWYEDYKIYLNQQSVTDFNHALQSFALRFERMKTFFYKITKLTLINFDEVAPLWQTIFDLIEPICKVESIHFGFEKAAVKRCEFQTFKEELAYMASWLKEEYEIQPESKIACVIPNLNEHRAFIEKTIYKAFAPQRYMNLQDKDTLPFNVSSGEPLASFNLIKAALKILKLSKQRLHLNEVSFLLKCPYILGYFKEYHKRSQFLFLLQNQNKPYFTINNFLKGLQTYCPILALHFYKWTKLEYPKEQSILEWLNLFSQKLELLGWPGERELSSQSFQLIAKFKEAMNELLSVADIIETCSKSKAIKLLQELCHGIMFQIKTGVKSIQILGTLEASGQLFHKIWIMQCNNHIWPAPTSPNPFIPFCLQKEFNLPRATSERELTFAKNIFNRFQNSCQELIVSSVREANNQVVEPSFFIKDILLSTSALAMSAPLLTVYESKQIEIFADNIEPLALSDEDLRMIKGGTGIFKEQAACPFRAFALFRLKARKANLPEPGLTALQRGNIIHSALELLWQRIQSFEALQSLSSETLDNLLSQVATAAILAVDAFLYQSQPKLFSIELNRVKSILEFWLNEEKKRDPFSVKSTEELLKTSFAKLPLTLIIDRIDKLANDALVLIDYKTNSPAITRWFGSRVDEPQLPLYAILYPEKVSAIMYAQVKNNSHQLRGIGDECSESDFIKEVGKLKLTEATNFQQLKNLWLEDLTKTAAQFINGDATVDPKYGAQTCNFCDLQSLCRIRELQNEVK